MIGGSKPQRATSVKRRQFQVAPPAVLLGTQPNAGESTGYWLKLGAAGQFA